MLHSEARWNWVEESKERLFTTIECETFFGGGSCLWSQSEVYWYCNIANEFWYILERLIWAILSHISLN